MNVFVLSIRSYVTGCYSEINMFKHNFESAISVFEFKFLWITNHFSLKVLQFFKLLVKLKAVGVKFFLRGLDTESFIEFNRWKNFYRR